ncbi:hypothetical protein BC831DRAFT_307981 [Entophlyctis helioformis]|nr:hypothetical protein BC831DRAFT_307981 [Entophlyctis helioformis]
MSDLSRPKRRPVNYGSADASNSSTVHTNASPSAPADIGSTSLASAAASVASPSPALSLSPNGHGQGATTTPNIPPRSTSLTPELERMQRARTLTPQHHYQQIASILSSATPETVAKALDAQQPQQPQQQSMWEPSSIKQVPAAITATASNVTRPQSVMRKPVVGRANDTASAPAPQTVATTPERSDPSSASSILRRSVTAASPKTPASSRLDVAASSSHAADQATIPDSPASSLKASRDPPGQQAGAEPTTAMPILKRSATLREMQRNARGRLLQKSNGSKDAGEALQPDMPPVGNLAGSTLAATSLASSSFVPSATPTSPTEWQIRLLALQSEVETLRKEKQMLEAQFKQLGVNPVSASAVPDAKAADQSTAETATSGSSTENPPAPLAIWKEIKVWLGFRLLNVAID